MKEDTAMAVADLVLLAAAGTGVWLILRDRRLRRPAFQLVGRFLAGTVPAYLAREIRTAWEASGQQNRRSMIPG